MKSKQRFMDQDKRSGSFVLIVALFLSVLGIASFLGSTADAISEQTEIKETTMRDGSVSNGVSVAVVTPSLEFIASLSGTLLFGYVLIVQKKREKWLIPTLLIYPILSLASFPVGPIVAVGLLVYSLINIRSFFKANKPSVQDSEL